MVQLCKLGWKQYKIRIEKHAYLLQCLIIVFDCTHLVHTRLWKTIVCKTPGLTSVFRTCIKFCLKLNRHRLPKEKVWNFYSVFSYRTSSKLARKRVFKDLNLSDHYFSETILKDVPQFFSDFVFGHFIAARIEVSYIFQLSF